MIKCDEYTLNGIAFKRWYSDSGFYVEREGIMYEEACDPAEYGRTYNETNVPIEEPDDPTAEELLEIITGEAGESV